MTATERSARSKLDELAVLVKVSGLRGSRVLPGVDAAVANQLLTAALDADPAALDRAAAGVQVRRAYRATPLDPGNLANVRTVVREARIALGRTRSEANAAILKVARLRELLGGKS